MGARTEEVVVARDYGGALLTFGKGEVGKGEVPATLAKYRRPAVAPISLAIDRKVAAEWMGITTISRC
jgi:hypothetical protein